MANRKGPRPAVFHRRDSDRGHHRAVPGYRRDRPLDYHRRSHLHCLPAGPSARGGISLCILRMAYVAIHRHADPDVQLDFAAPARVSPECRRGGSRLDGHDPDHERHRHLSPLSLPQTNQMVEAVELKLAVENRSQITKPVIEVQDLDVYYGTSGPEIGQLRDSGKEGHGAY